jgi:hypothetical protein
MTTCCICREPIKTDPRNGWKHGHNADPVDSGRACDWCNDAVVLPTRLRKLGFDFDLGVPSGLSLSDEDREALCRDFPGHLARNPLLDDDTRGHLASRGYPATKVRTEEA